MALEVQLLGQPGLLRDGQPVRLSGRKSWGLLAFLVLEPHPTRREVAARLVPEANDPLAALRWLLHQLRRGLEPEATIVEHDGQLQLELVANVSIDLLDLLGVPEDVEVIERLVRGELLEGLDFHDAPAFELWLSLQRTRVHDVIAEALWGREPDRHRRSRPRSADHRTRPDVRPVLRDDERAAARPARAERQRSGRPATVHDHRAAFPR